MEPDSSVLLSNIASQLRGDLSNLYIAASRLAPADAREQDPALDEKAALLDQSYYQLLRLVNELAAAQELESTAPFTLFDEDIVGLAASVFERIASLAADQGLKTRFLCPMETHTCAFHEKMVEQLLFQLLSNAFKFTPPGGLITLELRLSRGQVLLAVEDTGPGISKEEQFTLFSRWRCEGSLTPPPHGAGLGLALCRRIALGHNGTLELDPTVSKGSRFVFALPDRTVGRPRLHDGRADQSKGFYDQSGGFNETLLAMADALPTKAFLSRNQG